MLRPEVARAIVAMSFGVGARALAQHHDADTLIWTAYDRSFKVHYRAERAAAEWIDHGGEG